MASLVAPLVSGITGASSGTAEFYRYGTAVLSSLVFSDVNATAAATTHVLDANGGVVRYVTEPVDIIIKDSTGATVRAFTWFDDARTVRLENAGFTGPNATGQTVAGGRTTEDAAWSLLFASLGATDAKVSVNGTPTLIKDAIASSTGVFYNIVTYGAVAGQDSTSAIQAAVTAAANVGGIVFVPGGTYFISGAITVPSGKNITFLGAAPAVSRFEQKTNSVSGWISLNGGGSSSSATFINLDFAAFSGAVTAGTIINTANTVYLTAINCRFAEATSISTFAGTSVALGANGEARFFGCEMTHSAAAAQIISNGTARFQGCRFPLSLAGTSVFTGGVLAYFSGCTFSFTVAGYQLVTSSSVGVFSDCLFTSTATSSTNSIGTTGLIVVSACRFVTGSGGTLSIVTTGSVYEAGSQFQTSDVVVSTGAITAGVSQARDMAIASNNAFSGTNSAPDARLGTHQINQTAGATFQFDNPTNDGNGWATSYLILIYKNTTGAGRTPTFGTNYLVTAAGAVTSGNASYWLFRRGNGTMTSKWVGLAARENFTP